MIELITPPRSLAWMRKVHRPTRTNYAPIQLIETRGTDGTVFIPGPHGLCVRDGIACVHRGTLRGVPLAPTNDMATWAARTFFATAGLQPLRALTLDGFQRWVKDAPKPKVSTCTHCSGDGKEPDAKVDDDGLIPVCTVCHGTPKDVDDEPAMVEVGPLEPFLRYLAGANVGVGVAPIPNTEGGFYLHIRHVVDDPKSTGGDWRLVITSEPNVEASALCG
jgi:hypothetical protein